MTKEDVIELFRLCEENSIDLWIDGGWAVDALIGEQSRPHNDLDIVIQEKDVERLRVLLGRWRFKDIPRDDTSVWNFVLGDDNGRLIDIHVIVFDEKGNGLYGPRERGKMYPAGSLAGKGVIGGKTVNCVAPEYLIKFHSGYKLDENDIKDVEALRQRFKI